MYISSALSNKYNQSHLKRNSYTTFKQDSNAQTAPAQEQTNVKRKKNLHTIWILALTAFAIADGIWEHRSYKKNKATNEALQKGKEVTDKTIKELEEKTNKLKEDLKIKELELEQLKSKFGKNSNENPVGEFDKYADISKKIDDAKKKHSK